MTAATWGLLLGLSLLWGGAFFFVGVAVREVPPLTVVAVRVALAAACLLPVLWLSGRRLPVDARALGAFAVMGTINNAIPFGLLVWAQTTIPSGLASILNATTPIFAILIAHLALADERLAPRKLAGVILGLAGVAVLLGRDLLQGADLGTLAILACLAAACSYGAAGAFGRRFAGLGIDSTTVACGQLLASSALMVPLALALERPWGLPMPEAETLGALALLASASTALAYVMYFRLIATSGAVNATLVTLLMPPSAILLGWLFLGERLAAHHYVGMALIALGLLAIDGRALRVARARRPRRLRPE
jgi:drug/metabolite transporter (DMT)-like permease